MSHLLNKYKDRSYSFHIYQYIQKIMNTEEDKKQGFQPSAQYFQASEMQEKNKDEIMKEPSVDYEGNLKIKKINDKAGSGNMQIFLKLHSVETKLDQNNRLLNTLIEELQARDLRNQKTLSSCFNGFCGLWVGAIVFLITIMLLFQAKMPDKQKQIDISAIVIAGIITLVYVIYLWCSGYIKLFFGKIKETFCIKTHTKYQKKKHELLSCIHFNQQSKKELQALGSSKIKQNCEIHKIGSKYICISCRHSMCLDFTGNISCLGTHALDTNHQIALQLSKGKLWCNTCMIYLQMNNNKSVLKKKQKKIVRKYNQLLNGAQQIIKKLSLQISIKEDTLRPKGIMNIGVSCYLSAGLQVLNATTPLKQLYKRFNVKNNGILLEERVIKAQIDQFYQQILDKTPQQEKNKTIMSIIQKKSCNLNIQLKIFFNSYQKKQEILLNPKNILDGISQINKEYWNMHNNSYFQQLHFAQFRKIYLDLEYPWQSKTITNTKFGFYILDERQCKTCKQISRKINLQFNIQLDLTKKKAKIYHQFSRNEGQIDATYYKKIYYPKTDKQCCSLFTEYFAPQFLSFKDNAYLCNNCKGCQCYRRY